MTEGENEVTEGTDLCQGVNKWLKVEQYVNDKVQ